MDTGIWNLCQSYRSHWETRKDSVPYIPTCRWRGSAKGFPTLEIDSSDKEKIAPLIAAFQRYCEGKSNVTVVRYQLNTYYQTTESMGVHIRELCHKIAFCEYGDSENSTLKDQLVCGVKDMQLCDNLLQTPRLNLERCIEICCLSEYNASQIEAHHPLVTDSPVDAINKYGANKTRPPITSNNTTTCHCHHGKHNSMCDL